MLNVKNKCISSNNNTLKLIYSKIVTYLQNQIETN